MFVPGEVSIRFLNHSLTSPKLSHLVGRKNLAVQRQLPSRTGIYKLPEALKSLRASSTRAFMVFSPIYDVSQIRTGAWYISVKPGPVKGEKLVQLWADCASNGMGRHAIPDSDVACQGTREKGGGGSRRKKEKTDLPGPRHAGHKTSCLACSGLPDCQLESKREG